MTATTVSPPRRHLRPARPRPTSSSLREAFDGRRNHLTLLRLGLALTVAVGHSLAVGFGREPQLGSTEIGTVAVDAFFVISGFLITASYLRLRSVRRYAWHRFLRIMPGFWVCLVVTALLVAPLVAHLSGRPATSAFTAPEDSAPSYVTANAFLLMRQFGIAGLAPGVGVPEVFDGSLWTLFYEAVCYGGVVGLAAIGALRRHRGAALLALLGLWVIAVAHAAGFAVLGQERMLRLALPFVVGVVAWLYADRIPVRGWLAAVSAAGLVGSLLLLREYQVLGAPALAYLCLWAAVQRPPRKPATRDLSYGIYIYHWPVVLTLTVAGATAWGRAPFVAVSLALTALAGAASWYGVERRALSWKSAAWVDRRIPAVAPTPVVEGRLSET